MFPGCMQTCGVQLRWESMLYLPNSFWSIDNLMIGSNDSSVSLNRRDTDNTKITHHKRQTTVDCNLYYNDDFDSGIYNRVLWSGIRGATVTLLPCGAPTESHYWLYFYGSYTREAITLSLNLEGIQVIAFTLLFGSSINGCNQPSPNDGILVQYKIGDSGSWQALESYNTSYCCNTAPSKLKVNLPMAAQVDNVHLRWYQPSNDGSRYSNDDVWAIDEIQIGEINVLYEDTFPTSTVNTTMWLLVVGGIITTPPCGSTRYGNALYFSAEYSRQALTQHLDLRRAESISFYLRIGSSRGECERAERGENIELAWRVNNSAWSLLNTLLYSSFQDAQLVLVELPNTMKVNDVQLRISQVMLAASQYDTWSIDNFEILSYNASSSRPCSSPTDVTPMPSTPSTPTVCNYYYDNFDTGSYSSALWLTVTGINILLQPCGVPLTQHYAVKFSSAATRQLITHFLDLRGVEYISFYLQSANNNYGCRAPYYSYEGINVTYRITPADTWHTLEFYDPGCCRRGKTIAIYLPVGLQTNSVQLRWSQPSHSLRINYDIWVLDNVQIGERVVTTLYEDFFSVHANPTLWSSVVGGTVTTPPCGAVDVGNCLYFSQDGTREAVTQFLDLRQADGISFYLTTTTFSGCNGLSSWENISLSIRNGYSSWSILQNAPNATSTYVYVTIPAIFKVETAQFRWMQSTPATSEYSVWAIDSVKVYRTYNKTACSTACISDNFYSGNYSSSVWSSVRGAQVSTPPCNTGRSIMALYFNQSGTREAVTQPLDLRGLYAISFTLQMVMYTERCIEVTSVDNITVHYFINNSEWIEIGSFSGARFATETIVTIPLPLEAKSQSVLIRIAQPSYSTSVWSLGNFGIYSPNQCPPLSVTQTATVTPSTPTSNPSPLIAPHCNFYWDNFDNGLNTSTILSTVEGVRASHSPCGLPSSQLYGLVFYYSSVRQLITNSLDLRGVQSVSFYLISGSSRNRCSQPRSTEGITFSYRPRSTSAWTTLEYISPVCCATGKSFTIYFPIQAQISSVYLRWSQSSHPSYVNRVNHAIWVIDNVQIGKFVETTFYKDHFSNGYDPSIWAIIRGGSIRTPPCGVTYSGNALYFFKEGVRMAVTKLLDLRDATNLNFYLRIGSSTSACENADIGEDIELSYRINYNRWTTLQMYTATNYREARYSDVTISEDLQVDKVQFRIRQQVLGSDSYDVWSIDNFAIVSREQETRCSLACYYDNFNSGSYNSTIWNTVNGGSVTIPPCSDMYNGRSLYFNGNGTREAITNHLDLQRLYAISFTLQIGSYDGDCDRAEVGDDVILSYSLNGSNWVTLQNFTAASYTRATTVTVHIPRTVRTQGVSLRWAQTQHSGLSQDTWFIDNVGVYSPDQCPPVAYQITTPYPTVPPQTPPANVLCNYYSDNFDTGSYKTALWLSVSGIRISSKPCGISLTQHYAAEFYSSSTRQMLTHFLDLRGVEFISFYLLSGHSSNRCYQPSSNEGIYVEYRVTISETWHTLEYYDPSCCSSGKIITIHLPAAVQVDSVQLRWSQPVHYPYINRDIWVIDSVQFGENVDTILYEDFFTTTVSLTLWSSVVGGTVTTPPCGVIDVGNCLYFSQDGIREAVTQFLDLHQVKGVSFYLQTTSSSGCNGLNSWENITFSVRAGHGSWTLLQTITNVSSTYFYLEVPEIFKVPLAQFQWMQSTSSNNGYSVWAIDSIQIHSTYRRTVCSTACISDNFESGSYNSSIWSAVRGALVTTPPCNTELTVALFFNYSGTREAITQPLDLRGLYAVSFSLQIVTDNGRCSDVTFDESIRVYYSIIANRNWIEIGTFSGARFATETTVTIPLPSEARNQSVLVRISQSSHSTSVWSLGSFGIYSPNQCPPLSVTQTTTVMPPIPTTPPVSSHCNFYWDNFDNGLNSSTIWSTVEGVRASLSPCGLPSSQRYGVVFYSSSTRQLITNALDLRGVKSISFYLISGSSRNGCSQPGSTQGIDFSYRQDTTSHWRTLEYFTPICCTTGKTLTVHIPKEAQISSVYLRWSQSVYSYYANRLYWVIDNIQIGKFVETVLYRDHFSNGYDPSIWAIIRGGSIRTPPCGVTHSGNALYFFKEGVRMAVTKLLDLTDATSVSFYIRIGSATSSCENADIGEDIELSYRINFNRWTMLQMYTATNYREALYSDVTISEDLQVDKVQFRIRQQVLGSDSYDVWSIDNFAIVSREQETRCSLACYYDNFNSGSYNSTIWNTVNGGSVTIPPCSDMHNGRSLYFNGNGTREAITNNLDLRRLYAISFTLQIGSYDGDCDRSEIGDDVILFYSLDGSNWITLQSFTATSYTRATTVTVPISHKARTQGVSLRWAQTQHSGLSQDTWFIDNVGMYSSDECLPIANRTAASNPTTASPSTPSASLSCNYYSDNFDTGSFNATLWSIVSGVKISSRPCRIPFTLHHAAEFYSPTTRQMTTHFLDLRGVEFISFYLQSGYSSNGCNQPSINEGIYVAYRVTISGTWHTLEYYDPSCCVSGKFLTLYLPVAVHVESVQLRWSQPSHYARIFYDSWVLDNVQIGESIDTILYGDSFTASINMALWSSVVGGTVTTPPCGAVDLGNCLYFSQDGIREAVTQFLDLRQVNGISFYLTTTSSSECDGLNRWENVILSVRVGHSSWTWLQNSSNASSTYFYVEIPEIFRVSSAQFRWIQSSPATGGHSVWAIDTIQAHSTDQRTICSTACISDEFDSAIYNSSVWSAIRGALVTTPPCNTKAAVALFFNHSGSREAITQPLDLRGLYAVSFVLQIVMDNGRCSDVMSGESIRVFYSTDNGNGWIEIGTFSGGQFATETTVTIPLPLEARNHSVLIRISQPSYSTSVWSLGNFGIYSPNQCPPLSVTQTATVTPSTPTPSPTPSVAPHCKFYWDNFDNGLNSSTIWSTVEGVRASLSPCGLPSSQQYGVVFYSSSTRQLITNALDLRGVESVSFYLISGSSSNRCSQPSNTEGIYVAYSIGSTSPWITLEYFAPSCCQHGKTVTMYIPSEAKTSSVHLRWLQPSHYLYSNYDIWVLDDVRIGKVVETVLYGDEFSNSYDSSVWKIIKGGTIRVPPCGVTYSGNALYFFKEGVRLAVTKLLDLRGATSLSFYLRIGSSTSSCENADIGEDIELSYRINYNRWTTLQIFSATDYRLPLYVEIVISDDIQVDKVQFRIRQQVLGFDSYDVWSIDNFVIVSREQETRCSLACYYDNFNSGSYNSTIWNAVNGGSVTIPPCSDMYNGRLLYFSGNGTREAISNVLDLLGLYAISFTLQIGSFDNDCNRAEVGDDIILYYTLNGSNWIELQSFSPVSYTRATTVTVSIPRTVRTQGVSLRWAQTQHSGSSQDTWFIDNVGVYSPDQCPPVAYQTTTPSPVVPTLNPSPSLSCNYYSDNFDTGSFKGSLWLIVNGVRVSSSPCNLPSTHHYAAVFYLSTTRQLITHLLDLREVQFIRFYLLSGLYSINRCYTPHSSEGIYVSYRITSSGSWNNLEYYAPSCCANGKDITMHLPKTLQVNFVQLRWMQLSGTSSINYDIWVLDDVKIGGNVDAIFYEDNFTTSLHFNLWSSVVGGSVTTPPCGAVDVGNCLYFSQDGTREAVTQFLDLRQADDVSFYLMTTTADNCNGLDRRENIQFSIRSGHGSWTMLQKLSNASSTYIYTKIPEQFKAFSVQLRWLQSTPAISGHDVWSIDTVQVHSTYDRTVCSIACIYDNFISGQYNTSLWSSIRGAQVAIPPCTTGESYMALYFNQSGTREAVTQALDLRGLYAISFTLQLLASHDECLEVTVGETVKVYYSTNGSNDWIEIEAYSGATFTTETAVTIPLPLEARNDSVSIRISQPSYSNSVWSLRNFGVYSPDQCPPLPVDQRTVVIVPTPTSVPSASAQCSYYWDNFVNGFNSSTMWSTVEGVRASLSPCGLPSSQRYGVVFYSSSTRQLITNALDLRGTEYIRFYLISGSRDNRCSEPSFTEGIYVAYRLASTSIWHTLEYFAPSCCANGKIITLHFPAEAQTSSVYLRWSQPTHFPYSNYDIWVLDNIQIGDFIESFLYMDEFSGNYDTSLWGIIKGGSVATPPCGVTYSGNALYFSQSGERIAITRILDLRDARGVSFNIRIGDSSGACENADMGEDIELSYRINYNNWTTLQTFSATSYRDPFYVQIEFDQELRLNGVQLRIRQQVAGYDGYDVWSIDNFIIVSREKSTKCSLACYYDNFNSGSYNSTIWNTVNGGSVTIPPCSDMHNGRSLYFNGNGTREAITNNLNLRRLYAISFTLQIGSYDGDCDRAEAGDDIILYYSLDGTNWTLLKKFTATGYTRATTLTVSIPRTARTQGVSLRWEQTQHSGSSQDTWFIDNVGVYSPDQCPPVAYQPTTQVFPTLTPSKNLLCNYYFDNFNNGSFKTSLWWTVSGVRISSTPCGVSLTHHYAAEFYSPATRQLITNFLDLRGVELVRFYLKSGYYTNGCSQPTNNEGIHVVYRVTVNDNWNTLEYFDPSCCNRGKTITIYLPLVAKGRSIQLGWLQKNHDLYRTNYDSWVLDDVQIGETVDIILYEDTFATSVSLILWSSVVGGRVTTPPCGAIDVGNCLYFSQDGIREVVTQFLNFNQADGVSFYLMTVSSGVCDGLNMGENIMLSIRSGHGSWNTLQNFSNASDTYFYVKIPEAFKVHSAQLRWMQNLPAFSGYDVWAIDSVQIHSINNRTVCSTPCISDNFETGNYNSSVWNFIRGAQVTTPPCNTGRSVVALYFNQSGSREAVTQPLDLRGLYAISFTIQVVMSNERCIEVSFGESIVVEYSSSDNTSWIELATFSGIRLVTDTTVTISLPLEARSQSVSIRISQPSHSTSVWSIGNFGIYSPNQCPPLSVTQTTTVTPSTPTPSSTPSIAPHCNFYWDNFDNGLNSSTIWSTVEGVRASLSPCGLPSSQRYGVVFYSSSTRQLITNALDLRGVESISFYLISGSSRNRCSQPSSTEGVYFAYSLGSTSPWNTLEYFAPSCCEYGKTIAIYIPSEAQSSSVYLRWSQPTHVASANGDVWVIDNVQIGKYVETVLYDDEFLNGYDSSIWTIIEGGSVHLPPCGVTYSGKALYFFKEGVRMAVTQWLDLRDATSLNFYIRIGSSASSCENADIGEDIELSYRIKYGSWLILQTYTATEYREPFYVSIRIGNDLQVNKVQFRIRQQVLGSDSYDVWSIDNFAIVSREQETRCSLACYYDNFNSGSYNSTIWNTVNGGSVTIPPCSDMYNGRSLYFNGNGTREAISNILDLRGLYAISFTLQIGSYDNDCDLAEAGENAILFYSLNGSNWIQLQSFDTTSYTRATTVTVPIPRTVRTQGVSLRWAQTQHSGSSQDTWFIDNVGVYSPDQCPPVAYQMTSTITMPPSPSPTPLPSFEQCNGSSITDNFDSGTYDSALWDSVEGVTTALQACGSPSSNHHGMLFTSSGMRKMRTRSLDLRGIEWISFYLISGTGANSCSQPSSTEGIYVQYRIGSNGGFVNLEYYTPSCCTTGNTIRLYLPTAAKVTSVVLQWYQQNHSPYANFDQWIIDNIQIGEIFNLQLYADTFDSILDSSIWLSITGGSVTFPPCGATDSGNAVYFGGDGVRQLVSQSLDLSQASEISFYLRIGSSDGTCENAEPGEDIEVAFTVDSGTTWTNLAFYDSSRYQTAQYLLVQLPLAAKKRNTQLRFRQVMGFTQNEDTWSIDAFFVKGMLPEIKCDCLSIKDNFDNGYYNPQLWLSIMGGHVITVPCLFGSKGISFDQRGARKLLSRQLDLTDIYTISFVLRIGSSASDCRNVINGEFITLSYSLNSGSSWNVLQRYTASSYASASTVVALLPSIVQSPNVMLQWTQQPYMGNVWAIDNIKMYSTNNNCQELLLLSSSVTTASASNPITPSATIHTVTTSSIHTVTTSSMTSIPVRPNPTSTSILLTPVVATSSFTSSLLVSSYSAAAFISSSSIVHPTVSMVTSTTAMSVSTSIIEPTPSSSPVQEDCFEIFDPLNNGVYKYVHKFRSNFGKPTFGHNLPL